MKQPETRIFVVDDNPAIHEDFDKILAPKHSAAAASLNAAEKLLFGLPASGAFPAPKISESVFSLTHAMQGQNGLALVDEMLLEEQLLLDPMRGFLPKPYDQASLREAITRMPAVRDRPTSPRPSGLPA